MKEVKTKVCSKCKIPKPLSDFYITNDTYHYWCKACDYASKVKYRKTEKGKAVMKKSYHKNKLKIQEYYLRDDVKERNRIAKLTPARKKTTRQYERNKYNSDPQYNIAKKLRVRINKALRTNNANNIASHCVELIGCTYNDFRIYIESLFTPEMTWERVLSGEIQIDHITPCASFDLTDPEQQKQCFHYTNLQPLWETTRVINGVEYLGNLNKSAKLL
jgi:hypothetical protein